ncbi:MAG TPA: hypothetical protein DCY89_05720 [Gammaproteobacteria bacterium]|nr:hypothetical protein [Gammaproteobacteria bacterium]
MTTELTAFVSSASTQVEPMSQRATAALEQIAAMQIDSDLMYEVGGEELRAVKARMSDLDAQRKSITRPLDDAKKAVMDMFRRPLAMLEQAEQSLKGKLLAWSAEQERRRREEQAERERVARLERERLALEAKRLAAAGRAAAAEEVAQQAQQVVAATVPEAEAPRAAGIATVERWTFEVTDMAALVAYVAAHPGYLYLLEANQAELRKLVQTRKGGMALPGVRAYTTQHIAARS